jgi:hypothetical protein
LKEVGHLPENLPGATNDVDGDSHNIFSFVIRVWREETDAGSQAVWRGHITSIARNERHYFSDISEIPALIVSHLNDLK